MANFQWFFFDRWSVLSPLVPFPSATKATSVFDLQMLVHGQYHEWLVSGLFLSFRLLAVTLVLSLPLAFVIAILRLAPFAPARWLGTIYVESIRNVPLLAQMLFWYFGAPAILPDFLRNWLYEQNVEMISAIIALTLYTAAFMAEDIRSGIRSVAAHQVEASRSLGFSFLQTMQLIILPQSFRVVIPPLISQTLSLWKNTSIAMVIGVADLMFQAGQVESATFRSFEPFAFATFAYVTISLAITFASSLFQRKFPVRVA